MIQKDKKISRDFMCSILDALLVYIHTMINEKTYGTFSLRPIYHCKSPSFSIAVSSLESTPESRQSYAATSGHFENAVRF